jgi:hypothetical protein
MEFRAMIFILGTTVLSGCASRYVDPLNRLLVDTPEAVVRFEGKSVRLVGEVSKTKIPQILGVDVTSDTPDLRGMRAEAYGVLKRFVITEEEARALDRQMVAHRGAGSFWVLYDPKTKAPAQVDTPPIVAPITIPAK